MRFTIWNPHNKLEVVQYDEKRKRLVIPIYTIYFDHGRHSFQLGCTCYYGMDTHKKVVRRIR